MLKVKGRQYIIHRVCVFIMIDQCVTRPKSERYRYHFFSCSNFFETESETFSISIFLPTESDTVKRRKSFEIDIHMIWAISLRDGWTHQNGCFFLEKFQMAFGPPPHFRKIILRFFSGIHDRRTVYNGKNLQYKFLDWKWPPKSQLL